MAIDKLPSLSMKKTLAPSAAIAPASATTYSELLPGTEQPYATAAAMAIRKPCYYSRELALSRTTWC
jgi:hypothetical protein